MKEVILGYIANLFLQLFYTVGIIFIFGLIIHLLTRSIYSMCGRHKRKVAIATGFIGTPVHELGHAAACLLFGHKIKDIKLFTPSADRVMGYVTHSYNPRNFYQRMGNFFIGIAPILFGSGVIFLLMYFLAPTVFNGAKNAIASFTSVGFGFSTGSIGAFFTLFGDIVLALFPITAFSDFKWWIFIILVLNIAMHVNLSTADIKGGLIGLLSIILIFALFNFALALMEIGEKATAYIMIFGGYLLSFLLLSLILCLIVFALVGIIYLISKLVKSLSHR